MGEFAYLNVITMSITFPNIISELNADGYVIQYLDENDIPY